MSDPKACTLCTYIDCAVSGVTACHMDCLGGCICFANTHANLPKNKLKQYCNGDLAISRSDLHFTRFGLHYSVPLLQSKAKKNPQTNNNN